MCFARLAYLCHIYGNGTRCVRARIFYSYCMQQCRNTCSYIFIFRASRVYHRICTHCVIPRHQRCVAYVHMYIHIERYSSIYRKINATAIYHRLTMQQQYTQCLCTHRQSIQLYGACINVDRY